MKTVAATLLLAFAALFCGCSTGTQTQASTDSEEDASEVNLVVLDFSNQVKGCKGGRAEDIASLERHQGK